jgi:Ulp1 family protease
MKFNIPIRKLDLQGLQREEMINDEVVNFMMQVFQRDVRSSAVYIFSSFFYRSLCGIDHDAFTESSYEKVSAWYKV